MSELAAPSTTLTALAALQRQMFQAGWEIAFIDLDLTSDQPKAEIKFLRCDGRWLFARVDRLGRASFETYQRQRALGMSANTSGRRPLSPQVDDIFLGRKSCLGVRQMLDEIVEYVAMNSPHLVRLADMQQAWAAVMGAPLQIASEA